VVEVEEEEEEERRRWMRRREVGSELDLREREVIDCNLRKNRRIKEDRRWK
jgi:hypothetical protein